MKVLRFALGVCLVAFLSAGVARTQDPQARPPDQKTGAIAGTVQDNTAAVMPGVTVTITNAAAAAQTATADEKGEFNVTGLAPGAYTVSVTLQGFKDFRSAVTVAAGETARVIVTMQPAAVSEKVNVEGNAVTQVEQQSSQISGTVTSKELTSLMLNGRNFTQLIALTPGVSNQTGQDEALVGVKGSVKYSVNGGRVEYNSYEIDGGDILNASLNGSSSTLIVYPSIDSIGSLQVLTSNFGAMYGRSASGITVATTKSGADFSGYHGDAYFFLRNEHLNARNFFDQTRHAPLYQKYDPGGTLGGPLYIPGVFNTKKDKTFFFFSEEYRHEREPVTFNQAAPSTSERLGDFRDVCPAPSANGPLFVRSIDASMATGFPYFPDCPGQPSGMLAGPGVNILAATAVPGLTSLSPQSQTILASGLIPAPNSNSGCNFGSRTSTADFVDLTTGNTLPNYHCYDASVSPLTTWRQELFRIDHNFTSKQKLYFRYIHDAWTTVTTVPQWSLYYNSFPTVENNFTGPGLSLAAHLTSTFGTKLVNDLAMTYSTDHIRLTDLAGPGVTSLQRTGTTFDPSVTPCDATINRANCTPGGIGYLFGQPATDINGVPFGNKLPGIVISGSNFDFGGHGFSADTGYMPWRHSNPTYTPRDDATIALRNHTLQFGAMAIFAQRNEVNPPVGGNTGNVQGTLFFSNVNQVSSGNAFYDLFTFGSSGEQKTYTQDSAQGVYHNNYRVVEPYFQDDWKVTRRLTLNLGLRISLFGLYHEKNLTSYNFVPSQFNSSLASQLSYIVQSGALVIGPSKFPLPSNFVPVDLQNLSPYLTNGMVRCGVDHYKNPDGSQGPLVPAGCMTGHLFNPAPRIGFAWDPFGNGKTSIRGGYGIFFEHGTGNEANTGSLEGSPGNLGAGGVISMTEYGVTSWACIGSVGTGCPHNAGSAFPINVTSIPTKATWPYTQQWSFSVQRELPGKMLASVAYVGSKGTHLTAELNTNQLVPVNKAQNPFLPGQPISTVFCEEVAQGVFNPASTWNGNTFAFGSPGFYNALVACNGSPYNTFLRSPLPPNLPNEYRIPGVVLAPYLGQVYSLQNIANSVYHAMQLSLRRTAGPLTLGVSYTFSHSIDDASDRTEATFINAYNLPSNRASSDFDQRHLLNVSYVYQVPLMKLYKALNWADSDPTNQLSKHDNGNGGPGDLAKRLCDGWELSGITVFQTGTPFSVLNGGSPDGTAPGDNAGVVNVVGPASYPDLASNPGPAPSSRTGGVGIFGPLLGNPSRFVAPTGLTFGNAGRNYLNNPRRTNFDMAVAKRFALSESRTFEFRIETFNIFNHTQFRIYDPSNPGNTGNNVINCYAGDGASGANVSPGDSGCLATSSFLHPVDAHRPRTMQLGLKFLF